VVLYHTSVSRGGPVRVCERACGALCPGVLLSLPDGMEKLRAAVSYLCESWWTGELAGRDDLAPQMLAYSLQRCLEPSSMVVAVASHILS